MKKQAIVAKLPPKKFDVTSYLTMRMRQNLYHHMYEIAKEHADIAKQLDGKDIKSELKESMISILFSYTCLEAYINAVGSDELGKDWVRFENNNLESKWIGVARELATRKAGRIVSPFSDSKEPFKSFKKLGRIRDKIIIHRKAEFMDIVDTKYGNMDGTINIVNCDTAEWSCKIVKSMVRKLNQYINKPPADSWLL
ncbi:hypothetical protein ACFLTJ_02775 [Chloroflexota bacterium]